MKVTCFIEYTLDPAKLEQFHQYAKNWGHIIPNCGGELLGYFLPHEGTNNKAFGLISFASLAAYEQYRIRLKQDEDGEKNFKYAQDLKKGPARWSKYSMSTALTTSTFMAYSRPAPHHRRN